MTHDETPDPHGALFCSRGAPSHFQPRRFTRLNCPNAAAASSVISRPLLPGSGLPDSAVNKCSKRGKQCQQVAAGVERGHQESRPSHPRVFWCVPPTPPRSLIGASRSLSDCSAHLATREWHIISSHSCKIATHREERSRMFSANDQSPPSSV